MKNLFLALATAVVCAVPTGCDVDAALLRGAPEAYNFPPSVPTDSFSVDADKIHLFQLTSGARPEHDVVEAKFGRSMWAILLESAKTRSSSTFTAMRTP